MKAMPTLLKDNLASFTLDLQVLCILALAQPHYHADFCPLG